MKNQSNILKVGRFGTGRGSGSGRAFTLIELMAVILVILILAAAVFTVANYIQRRLAYQTARAQIAAMSAALESYKADWGYYPVSTTVRISNLGVAESSNNWILYRALSGQFSGGGNHRVYMTFPAGCLQVNPAVVTTNVYTFGGPNNGYATAASSSGFVNIYDPWGMPYNYYCSPRTPYFCDNNYPTNFISLNLQLWPGGNYVIVWRGGQAYGGQVNVKSYDLFSYGPNKFTYVPGATAYGGGSNVPSGSSFPWWDYKHSQDSYFTGGWVNPTSSVDDVISWK